MLIHSWLKLKDFVLRAGRVITPAFAPFGVEENTEAPNLAAGEDSAKMYVTMRSYFHNGGHDGFNGQVFTFLVFILLYVPCLAAMGVVVREIGLGLGVLMATVQTLLAWAIAVLLYQIPVGGSTGWIVTAVIVLIGTGIFLKLFGMKANKQKRFED